MSNPHRNCDGSTRRDLLTALDNLDRALDAATKAGDKGPLVTGVSATASQFLDVLRRHDPADGDGGRDVGADQLGGVRVQPLR